MSISTLEILAAQTNPRWEQETTEALSLIEEFLPTITTVAEAEAFVTVTERDVADFLNRLRLVQRINALATYRLNRLRREAGEIK